MDIGAYADEGRGRRAGKEGNVNPVVFFGQGDFSPFGMIDRTMAEALVGTLVPHFAPNG